MNPQDFRDLGIEVKVHYEGDVQDNVQTRLFCKKPNCNKDVEIFFDHKNGPHNVVCPTHGKIASFPNQAEYMNTVKLATNKILAAKGHAILGDEAKFGVVDDSKPEN